MKKLENKKEEKGQCARHLIDPLLKKNAKKPKKKRQKNNSAI